MDYLFMEFKEFICIYINDIVIFLASHNKYFQYLGKILKVLDRNCLYISMDKSFIEYLYLVRCLYPYGLRVRQQAERFIPVKVLSLRFKLKLKIFLCGATLHAISLSRFWPIIIFNRFISSVAIFYN